MSLRFNQVFVGLIALSFFSAFVVPARFTNPVRSIQGIFYPVARPSRAIAGAIRGRLEKPPQDTRAVADVREENQQLRMMVASLSGQLEELQRINADRELAGDFRKLCTPVAVLGNDAGRRGSLLLSSGSLEGIFPGMAVLCKKGMVGTIERSGAGGTQVQLITDKSFHATAQFLRYMTHPDHTVTRELPGLSAASIAGAGDGLMRIRNVEVRETNIETKAPIENPIRLGDLVVLNDSEWDLARGQILGQVEKITPLAAAALTADITVRPLTDLTTLNEVQVLNKLPANPAAAPAGTSAAKSAAATSAR